MELVLGLIIIALVGLNVFYDHRWYLERQKLLDRLMSRDYMEYAAGQHEMRRVKIPDKIRSQEGIPL